MQEKFNSQKYNNKKLTIKLLKENKKSSINDENY